MLEHSPARTQIFSHYFSQPPTWSYVIALCHSWSLDSPTQNFEPICITSVRSLCGWRLQDIILDNHFIGRIKIHNTWTDGLRVTGV